MTSSRKPRDDDFALLGRAPDAAIAGVWVSLLEAAGIVAYIPGAALADDWAIAQRTMGNLGADVLVPRSRLEEARAIVAKRALPDTAAD
jgi:hypothetical protein